jgi:2-C-methyl-D-erythritol 4-phosphate cytidylyltransferase
MNTDISKQYMLLSDKPLIIHTLEVFHRAKQIDEIILVVGASDLKLIEQMLKGYSFNKISRVIEGGNERQHSVYNGLMALDKSSDIVAIHDGARPLITAETIDESIRLAKQFGAVSCGMPIKETIKIVSTDGFVQSTPNREKVWITQTPQTFKTEIIISAHQHANQKGVLGTDDAALVEIDGIPVKMVQGSYENIKITTPEDLMTAEGILKIRKLNAKEGQHV